jgi:uncharacterized membrane protein YphA (DoxX/SURF4 family)
MALTTRVARPLIAGMFVAGGIDSIQHPEAKAKKADKVGRPIATAIGLPDDPITLVRLNGAVQVAGGVLLAANKLPRLASLALAGSLVPTTLAGHPFWEEVDETVKKRQRTQFLKNMAMLGGLLLSAADRGGRPSLSWRARRSTARAAEKASTVLPTRN